MKYSSVSKLLIYSSFLLLSCNEAKIASYKSENEALKAELKHCVSTAQMEQAKAVEVNHMLKEQNIELMNQIDSLKNLTSK